MHTTEKVRYSEHISLPGQANNLPYRMGYWSALIATLGGVLYFLVILGTILTGQFTMPPPEAVQLFGGIISLLFCPVITVMMISLHTTTAPEKKVFSQGSLAFTILFAVSVSINRFTQLGPVHQGVTSGSVEGLDWFLPYGDHSVMFGLEMLGWGWFLGLAMLMAAPIFSGGRIHFWLRWLAVSYGGLALTSAVLYLIGSQLASIGFIAWGLILFVITGLFTFHFKQQES